MTDAPSDPYKDVVVVTTQFHVNFESQTSCTYGDFGDYSMSPGLFRFEVGEVLRGVISKTNAGDLQFTIDNLGCESGKPKLTMTSSKPWLPPWRVLSPIEVIALEGDGE